MLSRASRLGASIGFVAHRAVRADGDLRRRCSRRTARRGGRRRLGAVSRRSSWLGTDNLGRDLLSRMIYGARITHLHRGGRHRALLLRSASVLGFTAAVVGGWFDTLMSRFVDLLMAIPTLIFALVVLSVLPPNADRR